MYWSNLIVPYCSPIFQIYQVDGLMAGRLFWEGEYGVRISTAWYQLNSNNYIKYYVGNGDSTLTTNLRFVEVRISTAWESPLLYIDTY